MNLFDDFSNDQSDFLSSTFSNVFQSFATDTLQRNGLIRNGTPPVGNPVAGQVGSPAPVYTAATAGLNRSKGFGIMGLDTTTSWLLVGGVVLIIGIVVLKR
jgi:hypothetical protein